MKLHIITGYKINNLDVAEKHLLYNIKIISFYLYLP